MRNVRKGNYRNPYILYSINETPNIESIKKLDQEIINRYSLNERQIEVVKKSISTRDTFYLQGPPGTGKTQTISAITNILAKNDKNVLMTSSTHEAINNFFDRLNELSQDDPNLILLKYDSNKKKNNDYSEEKLYNNFLNRINNFVFKKNITENKNKEFLNEIDKLINLYPSLENGNFISSKIVNTIKNKVLNDMDLSNSEKEVFLQLGGYSSQNVNINDLKNFFSTPDKISSFFDARYDEFKMNFLLSNNVPLGSSDSKKVIEIYETFSNENEFVSFSSIKKSFQRNNSYEIMFKLKKYLNSLSSNNENEKEFNKFIFEKNLINVIGITTTARTEITILNKTKNLFLSYPIDTVIIDEISKSTTPEILARVILAKKVIFAGDYMQLPPVNEIDETFVEKIIKNGKFENFYKSFRGKDVISNVDDKNDPKETLLKEFKTLYEQSFFAKQVLKIKKTNYFDKKEKAYTALNTQHRFTKEIMDIVNINYETDEKLEMPRNQSEFKKYKFKWNEINYVNDDVILFDTSHFDNEYLNELNKKNIRGDLSCSFDQKFPLMVAVGGVLKNSSAFNEYNAYLCLNICLSLLDENGEQEVFGKIGIICSTTNQKKVIKHLIEKDNKYKRLEDIKIKVDTIDNFQGREKEIVIVDFVRSKNKLSKNNTIEKGIKRNLDFNSSRKRNNVALSRAKNKLFLIGSFDYYSKTSKNEISELSKDYLAKISKQIRMWEN